MPGTPATRCRRKTLSSSLMTSLGQLHALTVTISFPLKAVEGF